MQVVKRGTITKYAFDNRDEPCLRVQLGEKFQIETEDAFTGMIGDDSDTPKIHRLVNDAYVERLMGSNPPRLNPVVGPIYVEGCEPGDLLAVHIDWIEPWRYGYTGIIPGIGPLHDSRKWPDCTEAHVQLIEHFPGPSGTTRDGKAKYSDKLTWDLQPFIGTMASASEREVHTSLLGQGPWCGNIDCRDVRAGHTIYINTYHEGGLLYLGDMHGSQADTEFTALADETRGTIQLHCTVVKNKRIPCVRIEKPHSIVAIGINQPLEQAVYDACDNFLEWLRDDYNVKPKDTYLRMSADPGFRIRVYQMVRALTLRFVVGAEYPKDRLFPAF
jgi:acetamidase/formamidase